MLILWTLMSKYVQLWLKLCTKKGVGMKTNPSTIGDQSKTKLMMT